MRWVTNPTGSRWWSRSTAAPVVPERRPRSRVTSHCAARKRGLVPVGVFTYPGHGSSGPDAREPAAQDQQAALTTAVRSLADVGRHR